MKFVLAEDLGAWISYGKNEVTMHKAIYETVPVELRQELEGMAIAACEAYHNKVADLKSKGEKVRPMVLKKETMSPLRKWIEKHHINTGEVIRISTSNPRIPSDTEVTRVVQKQTYFAQVDVTPDQISSVFDNFDSEALSDERVEMPVESADVVDLGDDLFDGDLLEAVEGLDDF